MAHQAFLPEAAHFLPMTPLRRIALASVLACAASACGASLSSARIADLRSNPARYQRHPVSIEGVVTNAWGVPMAPLKFYRVSDGTGDVARAVLSAVRVDPSLDPLVTAGTLRPALLGGLGSVALPVVPVTVDGDDVLQLDTGADALLAWFRGDGPRPAGV